MNYEDSSDDDMSFCDESENLFDDDGADMESMGNNSTRTLKGVREDVMQFDVIRTFVIIIVLTMAVISAEVVFIITTQHEYSNFDSAYKEVSSELIQTFYKRIDNALWVAQSVAANIKELSVGEHWPYVFIPSFDSLCEGPLHLSQASVITFSPLIEASKQGEWESFAAMSYPLTRQGGSEEVTGMDNVTYYHTNRTLSDGIYRFDNATSVDADTVRPFFVPIWQMSPSPQTNNTIDLVGILFDEASNRVRGSALDQMMKHTGSAMSSFLFQNNNLTDMAFYQSPRSNLYYPIVNDSVAPRTIVGSIDLQFKWETALQDAVEDYNETIIVVVQNSCGGNYTYQVNGVHAKYLGPGDHHDSTVGDYVVSSSSYATFASLFDEHGEVQIDIQTACNYRITVYPSTTFQDNFVNNRATIYKFIVYFATFVVVGMLCVFDCLVGRHESKVVAAVKQSDAIVRSLFPAAVADRLYDDARRKVNEKHHTKADGWKNDGVNDSHLETPKTRVKNFMRSPDEIANNVNSENANLMGSAPIADLFSNTTVLFADLAGFTAWSSEREPAQVFTLLETIYRSMDTTAKRMGVFKVETIGDCYVAATGLPEPQDDHAIRMARFARKVLSKVSQLTKRLEAQLGPGTADLAMRIGIHSGPVTAGVLRGQKARFQLFGDTMNMASRIESSGAKYKIHLSKETAKLLEDAGRGAWVRIRDDMVHLKGKGLHETYWLNVGSASLGSRASSLSDDSSVAVSNADADGSKTDMNDTLWEDAILAGVLGQSKTDAEIERLIDWNVDVMVPLLRSIIAKGAASGKSLESQMIPPDKEKPANHEVQMEIALPAFDADLDAKIALKTNVKVPPIVKKELRDYIAAIATGYPKNPFHSFEHCSHVILSATKLLKRIIAPDEVGKTFEQGLSPEELHELTYGIATDPICQFAVVFSALIHDVGHPGVPNFRLSIEQPELAAKYANRSVAEHRSVDVAFDLLMLPRFRNLRACIYHNEAECIRFRQLVINSVMATDIFDKELKGLREARWDLAFHKKQEEPRQASDGHRKATIVIEHIIQASDVAHTMQHFCIYQKWNERLFQEMYFAYLAGRSEKDPSEGWYQGELWFFNNYIIPLAHKLKECGVFGVSGDEYLHYACQNHHEWERKGVAIVEAMKGRAIALTEKKKALLKALDSVLEEEETETGSDMKSFEI